MRVPVKVGAAVLVHATPHRQRTLLASLEKAANPSPRTVTLVLPLSVPPVGVSEDTLVGCTK